MLSFSLWMLRFCLHLTVVNIVGWCWVWYNLKFTCFLFFTRRAVLCIQFSYSFKFVCIRRKAAASASVSVSTQQIQNGRKNATKITCSSNKRSRTLNGRRKATHQIPNSRARCTLLSKNCTCAYLIYICLTVARSLSRSLSLFPSLSFRGDWINWVHVWFIVQTYGAERWSIAGIKKEKKATKTAYNQTTRTKGECKCKCGERPQ